MPDVSADIRKTFNTPPDANPWTYAYEQDGTLETVVVNQSTALAAFNAVRTRFSAESFASAVKRIELQFFSSTAVEAKITKSDDTNPWGYQYFQDGHLETQVVGVTDVTTALNAVRDRYLAESFAGATYRIKVFATPQEQ